MNVPGVRVLATEVLAVRVDDAAAVVASWARDGGGRAVCAANVHMVMEALDHPDFAATLAVADLVVCDGRPLVWVCRLQGAADARQTRGMDLMLETCRLAARYGLRVGLYGGESGVCDDVVRRLEHEFQDLDIAFRWSPPFRPLTAEEDDAVVASVVSSGVQVLFVGLGCPKQERWMLAHRDRLPCVTLGVGGAFDMLAGRVRVAPPWARRIGAEWLYRLASEPHRLWRRYARYNARFGLLALRQVLNVRIARWSRPRQGDLEPGGVYRAQSNGNGHGETAGSGARLESERGPSGRRWPATPS